jgi:hypothetical protein
MKCTSQHVATVGADGGGDAGGGCLFVAVCCLGVGCVA